MKKETRACEREMLCLYSVRYREYSWLLKYRLTTDNKPGHCSSGIRVLCSASQPPPPGPPPNTHQPSPLEGE